MCVCAFFSVVRPIECSRSMSTAAASFLGTFVLTAVPRVSCKAGRTQTMAVGFKAGLADQLVHANWELR